MQIGRGEPTIYIRATGIPPNCGGTRFLRKEEVQKLYPHHTNAKRLDYVFRHGKGQKVPRKIGYRLIEKYKDIYRVGEDGKILRNLQDDLDDMKYQEVKSLAMRYGIRHEDVGEKADKLKHMVRTCRDHGITPLSEEEWERRKENKTTTDFTMPYKELLEQAASDE